MDEESGLRPIQENEASLLDEGSYFDHQDHQRHQSVDSTASPFRDEYNVEDANPLSTTTTTATTTTNPEKEHRFVASSATSPPPLTPTELHQRVGITSPVGESSDPPQHPQLLSNASKMFDRNNKGYLDPAERALRRLDSDNDGLLTIHNVYDIMRSLQDAQKLSNDLMTSLQREQKKAVNLKKAVIGLVIFAALLSVANIGTSFAAARLAKDTKISFNGDLVSKDTNSRVGTTDKIVGVRMNPMTEETRRRLQFDTCSAISANNTRYCTAAGTMDYAVARDMYRQLCPSLVTIPGACPDLDGGVERLHMTCGGKASIIRGGGDLPLQGPGNMAGSTWFPALPASETTFTYLGSVHLIEPTTADGAAVVECEQNFQASVVCDLTQQGNECIMMSTPIEPYCERIFVDGSALLLCGTAMTT
ncbi:hypothetical protein ACA910_022431 [Epithemia clementina (nom. ined.)]